MQDQQAKYELFQQSFNRLYEPLCRYAFTLVKEPNHCEDIVQESFLRIWEKRQDLLGNDGLQFYLYTAVRNNCLTFLDKQQRTGTGALTGHEMAAGPEPVEQQPATEADYDTLVKQAVEHLPPRCREVFVLSRLSGFTYQQIGDALNISVKTVENQMGKALKMLRHFIRQKQGCIIGVSLFLPFLSHLQ